MENQRVSVFEKVESIQASCVGSHPGYLQTFVDIFA